MYLSCIIVADKLAVFVHVGEFIRPQVGVGRCLDTSGYYYLQIIDGLGKYIEADVWEVTVC